MRAAGWLAVAVKPNSLLLTTTTQSNYYDVAGELQCIRLSCSPRRGAVSPSLPGGYHEPEAQEPAVSNHQHACAIPRHSRRLEAGRTACVRLCPFRRSPAAGESSAQVVRSGCTQSLLLCFHLDAACSCLHCLHRCAQRPVQLDRGQVSQKKCLATFVVEVLDGVGAPSMT